MDDRDLIQAMQNLKAEDRVVIPPLARIVARAELVTMEKRRRRLQQFFSLVMVMLTALGFLLASTAPGSMILVRLESALPLFAIAALIVTLTFTESRSLAG